MAISEELKVDNEVRELIARLETLRTHPDIRGLRITAGGAERMSARDRAITYMTGAIGRLTHDSPMAWNTVFSICQRLLECWLEELGRREFIAAMDAGDDD